MWDSFWDFIWYTLVIFAFIAYLMILFGIITDLFWRDRDLGLGQGDLGGLPDRFPLHHRAGLPDRPRRHG